MEEPDLLDMQMHARICHRGPEQYTCDPTPQKGSLCAFVGHDEES